MKYFPKILILAVLGFFGCDTGRSRQDVMTISKSRLKGIYMDRLYVGDSGWPESELYLGCDDSMIGKVKLLDTVQINSAVRISIPCEVLNEIVDSINVLDSLLDFPNHDAQLWICHRFSSSDTGLVDSKKLLPFEIGKAKIWWMMDHILERAPNSFKTAMKGQWPFPPRLAPPDSAWLDTVKQGLF